MYPILCKVGPFNLRTYGLMITIGVLIGFWLAQKEFQRRKLPQDLLNDLFLMCVILGLLGARLVYVILNWNFYHANPLTILTIWSDGGLSFHGAVIGGTVAVWWGVRRYHLPFGNVVDALVPSLLVGHAIGRIGCFFNGCCYGSTTTLRWGTAFYDPVTNSFTLPSHPTQLYEAIGLMVLFSFLKWYLRLVPYDGAKFVLWAIFYSALRFFVEIYRASVTDKIIAGLTKAQWLSVILFTLALVYHWRRLVLGGKS